MDDQPQVCQFDCDDLQFDTAVAGADPLDAGVKVVGRRVADMGCGVDDVQGVGSAAAVLTGLPGELDVLHGPHSVRRNLSDTSFESGHCPPVLVAQRYSAAAAL